MAECTDKNCEMEKETMANDLSTEIRRKLKLEKENEELRARVRGLENYAEQCGELLARKDKDIEWFKNDADEMRWNVKNLIALYDRAETEHRNNEIDFAIARLSILKLKLVEGAGIDIGVLGAIDKEIFDLKRLKDGE